jgi:hypothetical protein
MSSLNLQEKVMKKHPVDARKRAGIDKENGNGKKVVEAN